jgi:hypothetical protein
MNTATSEARNAAHLRVHIKENLYNRTGMKDSILVHALIAQMTDILAARTA